MNLKATFKLSTRFIGLIIISMTFMLSCGTDAIDPPPPPDGGIDPPPPTSDYPLTTDISLPSEFNGESYTVKTYVPAAYETNKNLPVIYTLEGIQGTNSTAFFNEIIEISQRIGLDAIVVAIGDYFATPDADEEERRRRDFFPNGCSIDENDGHLNFYQYVSQEVVAYIDAEYENDQDSRTLIGYGWSGVFTTDAMFREVSENIIFNGFISTEPLFVSCQFFFLEEFLQNQITAFSEISENIKFHYAESNQNDIAWLNTFIEDQAYSFLDVDYAVYEDNNQEEIIKPSFEQGLKFIYNIE